MKIVVVPFSKEVYNFFVTRPVHKNLRGDCRELALSDRGIRIGCSISLIIFV